MAKGKLILFFIFTLGVLILSPALISADLFVREKIDKAYTTDFEKIEYKEDLYGHNRGFTLTISSNSPKYKYEYEEDYPYITWGNINRPAYSWESRDYKDYGRYRDRNYGGGGYNYYNLEPILNVYRTGRDIYGGSRNKDFNVYSYSYPYNPYSYPSYSGNYGYRRSYW